MFQGYQGYLIEVLIGLCIPFDRVIHQIFAIHLTTIVAQSVSIWLLGVLSSVLLAFGCGSRGSWSSSIRASREAAMQICWWSNFHFSWNFISNSFLLDMPFNGDFVTLRIPLHHHLQSSISLNYSSPKNPILSNICGTSVILEWTKLPSDTGTISGTVVYIFSMTSQWSSHHFSPPVCQLFLGKKGIQAWVKIVCGWMWHGMVSREKKHNDTWVQEPRHSLSSNWREKKVWKCCGEDETHFHPRWRIKNIWADMYGKGASCLQIEIGKFDKWKNLTKKSARIHISL